MNVHSRRFTTLPAILFRNLSAANWQIYGWGAISPGAVEVAIILSSFDANPVGRNARTVPCPRKVSHVTLHNNYLSTIVKALHWKKTNFRFRVLRKNGRGLVWFRKSIKVASDISIHFLVYEASTSAILERLWQIDV